MYSITHDGKCAKHLCIIDEENRIVSAKVDGLVFDFGGQSGWTFEFGSFHTFKTGCDCKFKTSTGCFFRVSYGCTFDCETNCVVVRRDVRDELISVPVDKIIKLNDYGIKGYTEVKPIPPTIKVTLELTEDQIKSLRKQGIDI